MLGGTDLEGANFTGAILDGSIFSGSDVEGADFSGASILNADFSGLTNAGLAQFAGAYYDDATLLGPAIDVSQMTYLPEPGQSLLLPAGIGGLTVCARRRGIDPFRA